MVDIEPRRIKGCDLPVWDEEIPPWPGRPVYIDVHFDPWFMLASHLLYLMRECATDEAGIDFDTDGFMVDVYRREDYDRVVEAVTNVRRDVGRHIDIYIACEGDEE